MANICKIIATFIGPRPVRVKKARQRRGIRLQDLGSIDSVIEMLRDVWDLESTIDPGMPMDTYLICNGGYPDKYGSFFEDIDNTKTPAGMMRVIQRENIGLSFGAYAHAFKELRDKYEYWMFTEDDVINTKPGYLPNYIKEFEVGNIGFVATVGVAGYHDNKHAHGGCGFTNRSILDRVADKYGGLLPHANIEPSFDIGRHSGNPVFNHGPFCNEGEVPVTNSICQMGYEFRLINAYTDAYYEWKHGDHSEIGKE